MIGQIELTEEEQELADKIVFDNERYVRLEREQAIENGELSAALMYSLLNRGAIPQTRLRYFEDPAFNPGKSKESRAGIFLGNAKTHEAMYRHGHFLPYLRYFVYGADLPTDIKETFFAKVQYHFVTTQELVKLARDQARNLRRASSPQDYKLPDSFYQLALDCGCEEWDARTVREAVMRTR